PGSLVTTPRIEATFAMQVVNNGGVKYDNLLLTHNRDVVTIRRPIRTQDIIQLNSPHISGGQFKNVTTSPALFRLAARFDDVGFSDIVNIRNRVMELRATGAEVYQFEGGEPFMDTPEFIKAAMVQALHENKTRYAPSSGLAQLRAAIAEKLRSKNGIPVRDQDVIVLTGGMQGLFGAFQSIIDPGDEVLLFSPFWTPIKDLVAGCQGRSVLVPTSEARAEGFAAT